MKKILYYIAISVICALPFNSCTLDEETSTDVEKKNFMRDAKEAEIVLQGVYRSTIEDGQYGYHLSILFNLGTDMEQAEEIVRRTIVSYQPMHFLPLNRKYKLLGHLCMPVSIMRMIF